MGTRIHFSAEHHNEGLRNIKRQRLSKVAMAYAVAAWLAVQVTDVMAPVLLLPEWSVRLVLTISLLGLPVVLAVAWIQQKRALATAGSPGLASRGGRMIDYIVITILVGMTAALLAFEPGTHSPASRKITSIAVMPFRDLSAEKVSAYLGDGLAGELLNNLTRVDGLSVAARTSSFAFRDSGRDIREIGRHLQVDAIVDGSLRVSDQQIRITVQLIDIRDGFNLWSRTYSRELDDILSLQEEIGASIVDALRMELLGETSTSRPTLSASAYQRYLEGRFELHRRTPQSLLRATALFRDAIELDPDYALAYTGLADAGLLLVSYGNLSPNEGQAIAEDALSRALALDDQLAETYASLGLLRHQSGDSDAAEQAYRRAIQLDPAYSMAHMWLGNLLLQKGRLQESLSTYERARLKDPQHPIISANFASALFMAGRFEDGMAILTEAARVSPHSDALKRQMSAWSGKYGRVGDAMDFAREALSIDPEAPNNLLMMSIAAEGLGRIEIAEAWQKKAESVAPENYNVVMRHAELLLDSGRMVALDEFAKTRLELNPIAEYGPLSEADRMHLTWAGTAKIHLHDYDEGIAQLERAMGDAALTRARFEVPTLTKLIIAYKKSARDKEAKRILAHCWETLEDMRRQGVDYPGFPVVIAGLYAVEGKPDDAIEMLEDAAARGWKNYGAAENALEFRSLRRDSRFRSLMQRLRTEVSLITDQKNLKHGAAVNGDKPIRDTRALLGATIRAHGPAARDIRLNAK